MYVISLPDQKDLGDPLAYSDFYQLGEDREYFYIFRDQFGGYMVPKSELEGKQEDFRLYIQEKTGLRFRKRTAPVVKLIQMIKERRKEPYHL